MVWDVPVHAGRARVELPANISEKDFERVVAMLWAWREIAFGHPPRVREKYPKGVMTRETSG
jgi:hypothetical protein